jgi:hypothetical protein
LCEAGYSYDYYEQVVLDNGEVLFLVGNVGSSYGTFSQNVWGTSTEKSRKDFDYVIEQLEQNGYAIYY